MFLAWMQLQETRSDDSSSGSRSPSFLPDPPSDLQPDCVVDCHSDPLPSSPSVLDQLAAIISRSEERLRCSEHLMSTSHTASRSEFSSFGDVAHSGFSSPVAQVAAALPRSDNHSTDQTKVGLIGANWAFSNDLRWVLRSGSRVGHDVEQQFVMGQYPPDLGPFCGDVQHVVQFLSSPLSSEFVISNHDAIANNTSAPPSSISLSRTRHRFYAVVNGVVHQFPLRLSLEFAATSSIQSPPVHQIHKFWPPALKGWDLVSTIERTVVAQDPASLTEFQTFALILRADFKSVPVNLTKIAGHHRNFAEFLGPAFVSQQLHTFTMLQQQFPLVTVVSTFKIGDRRLGWKGGGDFDSYSVEFIIQWTSQFVSTHVDRVLSFGTFALVGTFFLAKLPDIHGWYKTASSVIELIVGLYHLWVVHGQGRPPDDVADSSLEDKTVLKGGVMMGMSYKVKVIHRYS
ncbi:putative beta-amylase [Helianthus annuus]|nr:putative beta-amylase [Helianthus annuus]KAJ0637305.1 putative beta-amylase [Helianthus annuus]